MFSSTVFMLLASGSVFGVSFFEKKFEEVLPITCMGISGILFIFGMFGMLKIGFWLIFAALIALVLISLLNTIIKKDFLQFVKGFFTPAFFIFSFLFFIICLCNRGKLAAHTDEFSHWVDSVKTMFLLDDFITNENSHSLFKSYPPIMALFQYFFQRVNALIFRSNDFVEEKVYVAYQVFVVSLILPFFKMLNTKKLWRFLMSCMIIICATLLFYPDIMTVVVIDPFISVLTGCAFANLLLCDKLEKIQIVYISMICFTLVLAKDIGLYFSCFICICFVIRHLGRMDFRSAEKRLRVKSILICSLPILLTTIAKILWKMELNISKVQIFGGKTELLTYTRMFFLKNDQSYKQEVVEKVKTAYFENRITIGDFDFKTSYFVLSVCLCLALFLFSALYCSKIKSKRGKTTFKLLAVIIVVQFVLYIYSLGAIYIANFSEYEAQNLASYQRYMDIVFRSLCITVIICFTCYFNNSNDSKTTFAIFAAIVVIITPFSKVEKFINRNGVKESISVRSRYSKIIDVVNKNCEKNAKIYFVSQEDKGYDYQVIRFSIRPRLVNEGFSWSLSEDGPFYDGDIWTKKISAADFRNTILTQEYDYVVICKTNDYFSHHYMSLFEDANEITDNSIFRLDRQACKLKRIG